MNETKWHSANLEKANTEERNWMESWCELERQAQAFAEWVSQQRLQEVQAIQTEQLKVMNTYRFRMLQEAVAACVELQTPLIARLKEGKESRVVPMEIALEDVIPFREEGQTEKIPSNGFICSELEVPKE